MKAIRAIRKGTLATGSFLAALFRHEDRVEKQTPAGYPVLEGWTHSAEERIVESALRAPVEAPARYALYCYEGAHRGETIGLRRDVESVGTEAKNTIVLTPVGDGGGTYQFFLGGDGLRLLAAAGDHFRVNGADVSDASLYDFDRLDLAGNRFVVLDLSEVMR